VYIACRALEEWQGIGEGVGGREVCVCVCVRERESVCVCTRARRISTSSVESALSRHISAFSHVISRSFFSTSLF